MSTRSAIGVMHGSIVKAVYCHHDGYISHNGRILYNHYDSAKANHLVALGNISVLGERIEPTEGSGHAFGNAELGVTVFYARDRGETEENFQVYQNDDELFAGDHFDYYYVMKNGVWFVSIGGAKWMKLGEVLKAESENI